MSRRLSSSRERTLRKFISDRHLLYADQAMDILDELVALRKERDTYATFLRGCICVAEDRVLLNVTKETMEDRWPEVAALLKNHGK